MEKKKKSFLKGIVLPLVSVKAAELFVGNVPVFWGYFSDILKYSFSPGTFLIYNIYIQHNIAQYKNVYVDSFTVIVFLWEYTAIC